MLVALTTPIYCIKKVKHLQIVKTILYIGLDILYTCGPHIVTLPTRMGILYLMRHARVYTHAQINFTRKILTTSLVGF